MSLRQVVPPVYRLTCDHDGCTRYEQSEFEWYARRDAKVAGWQVRPNAGKGSRTAPDLCPQHRDIDSAGEPCPCSLYDHDPDASSDDDDGVCACGHVFDEHEESGACQAELVEMPS
jgi:ferredoxin-thioredoxin reductase catalytic subunit